MNNVTICRDPFDPSAYEFFIDVGDVGEFIKTQFDVFPDGAKIYCGSVSETTEVPLYTREDESAFRDMTGDFFVVVYPEGPLVFAIIAIVVALVAIGLTFLLRPSSNVKNNNQQTSPNNSLSNRSNSARPNERIPDIVGTVNCIPDLIGNPYREFINSQEVEIADYAIGVGLYDVPVESILDDQTQISAIAGASVEIYAPNTSANSGDAPQVRVGSPINRRIITAQATTAVNGQVLQPPNSGSIVCANNDTTFGLDNIQTSNSSFDYTKYFAPDDTLVVSNGTVDGLNLNGTYPVLSVTANEIILANPGSINPAWNSIPTLTSPGGGRTDGFNPTLSNTGVDYIGWFYLAVDTMSQVWFNFVATNGMYKDDGTNQYATSVAIEVTIQGIDANYGLIGQPRVFTTTLQGSATVRSTRATTLKVQLPIPGRCAVKVRRTTPIDLTFKGTIVDEVQWRDCYAVSPVTQANFGNVTTVQSLTYATEGALSVKSRKLNMLVTRKLLRYFDIPSQTLLTPAAGQEIATKNAADAFMYFALSSTCGRRPLSELDVANIYNTLGVGGAISTYFGTDLACEFCYTFDDANTSFEETVSDITQACFCTAYREAKILRVYFEQKTTDSVMLFNHRNKKPKSETRSYTFGAPSDNDGIELDYIEMNQPNYVGQGTTVTLYFPSDRSALNAKKVKTVGVFNYVQAMLLGHRYYNKLMHQWISTQFDGTTEARLLLQTQRFLCADNTRADTVDGYITSTNALEIGISQRLPASFLDASTMIAIQHPNRTVQLIPVVAGSQTASMDDGSAAFLSVILAHAPAQAIVIDPDNEIDPPFTIVRANETKSIPFLLTDKTPGDNDLYTLKGVNYDDRYYSNDGDVISGALVNTNSNYIGVPYNPTTGGSGDESTGLYRPHTSVIDSSDNTYYSDPTALQDSSSVSISGDGTSDGQSADITAHWAGFTSHVTTTNKTLYLNLAMNVYNGGSALATLTHGTTSISYSNIEPNQQIIIPLPIGTQLSMIRLDISGYAPGGSDNTNDPGDYSNGPTSTPPGSFQIDLSDFLVD